jgi:hypothetical protein
VKNDRKLAPWNMFLCVPNWMMVAGRPTAMAVVLVLIKML